LFSDHIFNTFSDYIIVQNLALQLYPLPVAKRLRAVMSVALALPQYHMSNPLKRGTET